MMYKTMAALCALLWLSGCAHQKTMYQWGDYEDTLFVMYNEPAEKQEALAEYIAFINQGGTAQKPIAPGLLAEAGTFMLEKGDLDEAIKFYQLEYDAWPESQPMMGTLIQNLEARRDQVN